MSDEKVYRMASTSLLTRVMAIIHEAREMEVDPQDSLTELLAELARVSASQIVYFEQNFLGAGLIEKWHELLDAEIENHRGHYAEFVGREAVGETVQ